MSRRALFVLLLPAILTAQGACDARVADTTTNAEPWNDAGTIVLPPVDKIDLLIDVDDSPGMANKQPYLAQAVAELLARIEHPSGRDSSRRAISDIHVGVVTSSLGSRGGDLCDPATLGTSVDGRGELQAMTTDGSAPPIALGEKGCGIESQLESWYRFLIQPDPYEQIGIQSGNPSTAAWQGVDATILAQRRAFLRPDSLVIVVVLTDEDDSEVDVRSIGGTAFDFLSSTYAPSRGTADCEASPIGAACTSCAFASNPQDASCTSGPYSPADGWDFDPNLRHVRPREKYGIDFRFPLARYDSGLQATHVADRRGEYPEGAGSYVGNANCTNPLYASMLPDGSDLTPDALCKSPVGFQRTPARVFFAAIAGVPADLVHGDDADPAALTNDDWLKILGSDPNDNVYDGIDPRMIESDEPRPGVTGDRDTDVNGQVDLEYACTFAATQSQLASAYPSPRVLTLARELDSQGVAASICPVHAVEQMPDDVLYGYRPAMSALYDRVAPLLQ